MNFEIKQFILNSNSKIICKICKGIVSSPIELFCDDIFRNHCLNNWSEKINDKCPTCNKVIYNKPEFSENIQNILNNLNFSEKK